MRTVRKNSSKNKSPVLSYVKLITIKNGKLTEEQIHFQQIVKAI